MNVAGLVILAVGAFFVVVGVKGTQHAALPSLFPASSAANGQAPAAPGQPTITIPGVGSNIPITQN